ATLAVLLALWSRGAVYVPLDPALPRERLFAMCETASLDLIVTEPAMHGVTTRLPCALLLLEPLAFDLPAAISTVQLSQTFTETMKGNSAIATGATFIAPPALALPAAYDLAYILFTSGSSGTPKGVRIAHGNLAALFTAILPLLDLPEGCRVLGCANFAFDIAFFELLAPLLCGGTLVLADSTECSSPLALLQLLERERVNVVQATPSHWQLLTALPWTRGMDVAIATGEALLRATASAVLRHSRCLWNLYGPTECTIWASAHRVTADDLLDTAPTIVSIGRGLQGYTLTLVRDGSAGGGIPITGAADDASITDRDSGELVIGGKGVGLGYCGNDEASDVFERCTLTGTRAYRSGDLCRRDANGLLHYLGRRDNQVKHNGYRIELGEIEQLLQGHMSIKRAACAVRPASGSTPGLLFACVEFRPGLPNRDKTALNAYLADHLPAWMLPQRYFFVDRLPLTANGKLDRKALLSLAADAALPALAEPACVAYEAGSLDARVAGIFCEVLDIERIGPCDSFLDMGGSSMLAATLVLTLNERLGTGLTLRQALTTPPTVSRIVQLLRAESRSNAARRH
ncbi:MAG: non-ribosomal peptide synthetase, partial [Pseudomonadota bacterium]|nr:non-ribosomal peptide synthetase [Pseudomonadota bacterium]